VQRKRLHGLATMEPLLGARGRLVLQHYRRGPSFIAQARLSGSVVGGSHARRRQSCSGRGMMPLRHPCPERVEGPRQLAEAQEWAPVRTDPQAAAKLTDQRAVFPRHLSWT